MLTKGVLSNVWRRILIPTLRLRPGHPIYTSNYLKLQDEHPGAAMAVADALESGDYKYITLYTAATEGHPLFLIGQQGRRRVLLYPGRVPPMLEADLLINALRAARRSLLGYVWSQEGGSGLVFGLPLAGLVFGLFGYAFLDMANHPVYPEAPVEFVRWISYAFMTIGACIVVSPLVWAFVSRSLLRRAIFEVRREPLRALDRAFDQTVKPPSSA